MKTYKTYTMHTVGRLTVYVSDDTHCVPHAVAWDSSNPVTLYPYIRGYRLKSSYTCGHSYQLNTIQQTCDGFVVCFGFESPLGKESYCF